MKGFEKGVGAGTVGDVGKGVVVGAVVPVDVVVVKAVALVDWTAI